MTKIIKSEKILLKNHPEINESAIQKFIFDDPSVLGLGELIAVQREKIQPMGGRLDMLLQDADKPYRYEVEIQLGSTDASHIIRTIEYWDIEKKRYPKYDHCAVIVAEEITGRFMNVISLFNGAIPLIALQMSAVKHGDDIELIFTKVLDRIIPGDDEDDEVAESTDRPYWEKRVTPTSMKTVDKIFADLKDQTEGYELKYNKFYVGIAKNGVARNFISFNPRKKYVYLSIKGADDSSVQTKLDDAGLDATYDSRNKQFSIRLDSYASFEKNKDLIIEMVKEAKKLYGESGDE